MTKQATLTVTRAAPGHWRWLRYPSTPSRRYRASKTARQAGADKARWLRWEIVN